MASSDKWYFSKEQLDNSPSKSCGCDSYKELSYRQQAANFIQDMGQKLKVSQLCINTAIVYMHRFYVFHSFTNFPWHQMAAAALFLAAKVEEQPRKLEYVIRIANICRNPRDTTIDVTSDRYLAQSQDLVFNENVLLQTLGFDVAIDHPHTHVVRCCHLVRASKDLAQTSYFMASNSLHLTTMCLQYKPTVVACFCIHLACKWSNWEIPLSNEKKEWFSYVDPSVTAELLQQLTEEFLVIFESCPSRLKEKIMAIGDNIPHNPGNHLNSPFDTDPKKIIREDSKESHSHRAHDSKIGEDPHKHRSSRPHDGSSSSSQQMREREYREKKERERLSHQHGSKPVPSSNQKVPSSHGHHRPLVDPKSKSHSRHPPHPSSSFPPPIRAEPRDILREAVRDSPFGIASSKQEPHTKDRDPQVRCDKDKRDYLLKTSATDPNLTNTLNKYPDSRSNYSMDKHRIDPNRPRPVDPTKVPVKHDATRRHEESKTFLKTDMDNMKKHSSGSAYANKTMDTSTSQKTKMPFTPDAVPKHAIAQQPKHPQHNGSSSLLSSSEIKQEEAPPIPIKRPSLFSPEKTPPSDPIKLSPLRAPREPPQMPKVLSPMESPVDTFKRSRNCSTSSEPELRLVMKKIDQVEGFENLMRDTTIDIPKSRVAEAATPSDEIKKEVVMAPPPTELNTSSTLMNGIETNPTLISNLLKESASVSSHLPSVSQTFEPQPVESKDKEHDHHHHHKSKKKNKEKHKHKDKNRDDKEKKKKHKDKDREKHKHKEKSAEPTEPLITEPIKIKIHKDKIQPIESPVQGLKIKIPKDRIKTEGISDNLQPNIQPPVGGLKIKIPKEIINNCNTDPTSRKRERERTSSEGPPPKTPKTTYKEGKQNGRHSYKVHLGDGDQNRLAESKYISKTSSS